VTKTLKIMVTMTLKIMMTKILKIKVTKIMKIKMTKTTKIKVTKTPKIKMRKTPKIKMMIKVKKKMKVIMTKVKVTMKKEKVIITKVSIIKIIDHLNHLLMMYSEKMNVGVIVKMLPEVKCKTFKMKVALGLITLTQTPETIVSQNVAQMISMISVRTVKIIIIVLKNVLLPTKIITLMDYLNAHKNVIKLIQLEVTMLQVMA